MVLYGTVGAIGTAVDFTILYALVDFVHAPLWVGVFVGFVSAATSNFFLNKHWTYRNKSEKHVYQYGIFMVISIIGLSLTSFLMWLFTYKLLFWYMTAKVISSAIVLVFNYTSNTLITFAPKRIQ